MNCTNIGGNSHVIRVKINISIVHTNHLLHTYHLSYHHSYISSLRWCQAQSEFMLTSLSMHMMLEVLQKLIFKCTVYWKIYYCQVPLICYIERMQTKVDCVKFRESGVMCIKLCWWHVSNCVYQMDYCSQLQLYVNPDSQREKTST